MHDSFRGSLGFGEEALQSLPGKIGSQVLTFSFFSCSKVVINICLYFAHLLSFSCIQDVQDVLTALDYAVEKGLIDSSKVAVLGGSHGGFLTTHLVGQVWFERYSICMLSFTDFPWTYFSYFGL